MENGNGENKARKKNSLELPEPKIQIYEIKNLVDQFHGTADVAEDGMNELGDRFKENIQNNTERDRGS